MIKEVEFGGEMKEHMRVVGRWERFWQPGGKMEPRQERRRVAEGSEKREH